MLIEATTVPLSCDIPKWKKSTGNRARQRWTRTKSNECWLLDGDCCDFKAGIRRRNIMANYEGIDFANRDDRVGRCFLRVDDSDKTVTPALSAEPRDPIAGLAVDCPFGTTEAFETLLKGERCEGCEWDAGFKTRATENWLRNHLWDYQSNRFWRTLPSPIPQLYVNKTGHIQSTVGMVIVPAFLHWLLATRELSLEQLRSVRLGHGNICEAHPRTFLYSIVERVFRKVGLDSLDWREILSNVVTYKDSKAGSHSIQRQYTYGHLREHSDNWLWDGYRLGPAPDQLFLSDHLFDAWLTALTAFAHASQQTIDWEAAGLKQETVEVEGHILVLSQPLSV
jgi:hypothetical protein